MELTGNYREQRGSKGSQKGAKREPKGGKREPKGAKCEPKDDQNASKNLSSEKGSKMREKRSPHIQFAGLFWEQFSIKNALKNQCKNRCRKSKGIYEKVLPK